MLQCLIRTDLRGLLKMRSMLGPFARLSVGFAAWLPKILKSTQKIFSYPLILGINDLFSEPMTARLKKHKVFFVFFWNLSASTLKSKKKFYQLRSWQTKTSFFLKFTTFYPENHIFFTNCVVGKNVTQYVRCTPHRICRGLIRYTLFTGSKYMTLVYFKGLLSQVGIDCGGK